MVQFGWPMGCAFLDMRAGDTGLSRHRGHGTCKREILLRSIIRKSCDQASAKAPALLTFGSNESLLTTLYIAELAGQDGVTKVEAHLYPLTLVDINGGHYPWKVY